MEEMGDTNKSKKMENAKEDGDNAELEETFVYVLRRKSHTRRDCYLNRIYYYSRWTEISKCPWTDSWKTSYRWYQ
jgi:hypothetical protein